MIKDLQSDLFGSEFDRPAFAPDGPERCSGLPVARYDDDSLGRTLGRAFAAVSTQRHTHTKPSGAPQAVPVQGVPARLPMNDMSNHNLRTFPPILRDKDPRAASAFTPQNLLREARRQKGIPDTPVPEVCILDPDGDIVRYLRATGRARQQGRTTCPTLDAFANFANPPIGPSRPTRS